MILTYVTPPHQLRITLLRNPEVYNYGVISCSGVAPIISGYVLHTDHRWAVSSFDVIVVVWQDVPGPLALGSLGYPLAAGQTGLFLFLPGHLRDLCLDLLRNVAATGQCVFAVLVLLVGSGHRLTECQTL
jgi:hypothetical protein